MKVITITQTKGGAGKTSLAMLLVSAALERDLRVHVIDADHNAQILKWKASVIASDASAADRWPSRLTVTLGEESEEKITEVLTTLDEAGTDLVIVDTRGGSTFATESYALLSDVILIPVKPVEGEFREAGDTWAWMERLRDSLMDPNAMPPVRSVVMAPPSDVYAALRSGTFASLPATRRAIVDSIGNLDPLPTVVPHSRIIEEFRRWGPLILRMTQLESAGDPSSRLQLRNFAPVKETAIELLDDAFAAMTE